MTSPDTEPRKCPHESCGYVNPPATRFCRSCGGELDYSDASPVQGFAPPTDMGEVAKPVRKTSWPKVVGVIAIIFGILGTLGGAWGFFALLLIQRMKSTLPPETVVGLKAIEDWKGWTMFTSGLAAVLGVFLLVGGIRLVKRRYRAVGTIMTWAILKILLVAGSTYLSYMIQQQQLQIMSEQASGAGAMPAGFVGTVSAISAAISIVWGWALPVFMLIWFSRGKIKEEVAGWS